jgi:hypothetical protein
VGSLMSGSPTSNSKRSYQRGCCLNTSWNGDLPVTAPGSILSALNTSGKTWYHSAPGMALHNLRIPCLTIRL